MGAKKIMKLIDPSTGLMECKICGSRHVANLKGGGKYHWGSWQCPNKCRLESRRSENKKNCADLIFGKTSLSV